MLNDLDRLPTLSGPRVALRWLQVSDAADLFAVFSNPTVMRYWSRLPMTQITEAEALVAEVHASFATHRLYQWGIEYGGRIIGHVTLADLDVANLTAEIGFALAHDMWGQGLAGEAVSAVLRLAFDTLRLRRIEADVDPRNAASLVLLKRLGFTREGLARERWFVGGAPQDSVILGLLRREWAASIDSWATHAKQRLREGETISIRPRGRSMVPLIESGELVTISPVDDISTLRKGDIVLVRVNGDDYLHLIKAIRPGPRFEIGNNRGGINGWAGAEQIFGRLISKG